jgi:hypothetical protein
MKKILVLFVMVIFGSISLINCSGDNGKTPEDNHNSTVQTS